MLRKITRHFQSRETVIVASISLIAVVFNLLHIIIGAAKIPSGTVYLWVGHYYMDFWEYTQQIAQGQYGKWLVENQFATDDPTKTFLGWGQYLIYGKIGKIFHLSPVATYWATIIIFSFGFCLLSYLLIKRLFVNKSGFYRIGAFLLFLFATPFFFIKSGSDGLKILSFEFWYGPMTILERLGHVPHHLLGLLISATILILVSKTLDQTNRSSFGKLIGRGFTYGLILIFLLSFLPFQVINFSSALIVTALFIIIDARRKNTKLDQKKLAVFLATIFVLVIPSALLMRSAHQAGQLFSRLVYWETAQQQHPPLVGVILTLGPVFIIGLFGLKKYFKSLTTLKLFFFFFVLFSYMYFFTDISLIFGTHNMRFLNPISYILFAVLAVLGLEDIAVKFKIKEKLFIIVSIAVLMIYFIPVNITNLMTYLDDSKIFSNINYVASENFEGFQFLAGLPDHKGVMTAPKQNYGLIIPAYSDRNAYIGRMMFTGNLEAKMETADRFYKGLLTSGEVKDLFIKNNMGYVFLSQLDGYLPQNIEKYGLFEPVYNNGRVIIYRIINH